MLHAGLAPIDRRDSVDPLLTILTLAGVVGTAGLVAACLRVAHCSVVSAAHVLARLGGARRGSASPVSAWPRVQALARGERFRLAGRGACGLDDARTPPPADGHTSRSRRARFPPRSRPGDPRLRRLVRLGIRAGARVLHTPARVGLAHVPPAARSVLAARRGSRIHPAPERSPPERQPAGRRDRAAVDDGDFGRRPTRCSSATRRGVCARGGCRRGRGSHRPFCPSCTSRRTSFASLPLVAVQASTTYNDLVVASFIVIAAYAGIGRARSDLVLLALAIGLALTTKFTGILALPVLALVVAVANPIRRWPALAGAGLAGIALGAPWYSSTVSRPAISMER